MMSEHTTRPVPIRILILDHQRLTRQGLRLILERSKEIFNTQLPRQPQVRQLEVCGNFFIAGETGERKKALDLAKIYNPNIILLELNLDNKFDILIIEELLQVAPAAKIILVTAIDNPIIQNQAIQAGAVGIISKVDDQSNLIKAILKVNAGGVWINRRLMADVLNELRYPNINSTEANRTARPEFDEREHQIIQLIDAGLINREIAKRLSVSESCVRHSLTSLYQKFNVKNRLQLLTYAYQHNLVDLWDREP